MFFFFKKGRKRKNGKSKGTRSSYKASKNKMGYVQSVMLYEPIIKKERLLVYAESF